MHPDTLVLRKPENIRNSAYAGYSLDPDKRGLFGTRGDSRLEGKALIIGVGSRDDAVAIPVAVLEKQPLVEVTLSGEPLLVFYSRQEATPAVFRATLNSRQLSFHLRKQGKEILLEDNQTHSTWSPLEGRATAGPLMGQQLARVPYFHSYWYAWSAYRPKTRLVGAR